MIKFFLIKEVPAKKKKGWSGFWDATVASHPGPDEELEQSTLRRIEEEIGLPADQVIDLRPVGALEYREQYNEQTQTYPGLARIMFG